MQSLADPVSLRAVINECLLEPRVLQCLLGSDPVLRIVDKDLLQQIQELTVEWCGGRDELL